MDIHKPKAAHSLREFLIEIGTIICGILIALGLEQAVEALHRNEEVKEAREAIDGEMAKNLGSIEITLSQHACTNDRLDEIEAWLNSFKTGRPLNISHDLHEPVGPNFLHSVWSVASGSTAAKMPFELRARYGLLYDDMDLQERYRSDIVSHFTSIYRRLRATELSPREIEDLQADVDFIRADFDSFEFTHRQFDQEQFDRLGIRPDHVFDAQVKPLSDAVCRPLLSVKVPKHPPSKDLPGLFERTVG